MTKLYFKDNKAIRDIADPNVMNLVEKNKPAGSDGIRVRVIVRDDNYEAPKVQLAEYIFEREEPWKSAWWMLDETTWDGVFTPDDTWELVELED